VRTSLIPFFIGTVIIYVFGVAWLSVILGDFSKALSLGMLPFLPGDLLKLIARGAGAAAAWKITDSHQPTANTDRPLRGYKL